MRDRKKIIILASSAAIILICGILILTVGGLGKKLTGNKKENNPENTTKVESTLPKGAQPELIGTDPNSNNSSEINGVKHIKNVKVKAIYYTGIFAGLDSKLDHMIDVINKTELNAIVIDIKEGGMVNYDSQVPAVKENKLYQKYFDPAKVIKKLHDNNIYVIGRIVCFRDNGLASKRLDLAIKKPDGTPWLENKTDSNTKWTNPYNEEVWKYNIDIAKEAINLGFDEIQFDYVRFPTAKKSDVNYGINLPEKADAISGFLKMAGKEINEGMGIPVSADIFGIVCISPPDGRNIGQVFDRIGMDINYISPMVYPSHYANAGHGTMGNGVGQKIRSTNFTAPDLHPYDVVYNTLLTAKEKIAATPGYKAKVRPYLQDFTASYIRNKNYYQEYGAEQVRQQIQAVYDAGYDEWILWDGRCTYSEDAFIKDK